jgi:hypothetical protein
MPGLSLLLAIDCRCHSRILRSSHLFGAVTEKTATKTEAGRIEVLPAS